MWSENPFSTTIDSTNNNQYNPRSDLHRLSANNQTQQIDKRTQKTALESLHSQLTEESEKIIDNKIIKERNNEMKFILSELSALQEIMTDFSELVVVQGDTLQVCEKQTENAVVQTKIANEHLEVAEKEVKKSRRAGVGAVIGTAVGGGIGLLGFAVNPAVGAVTLVLIGAFGGGVGGLVGMASKPK